MLGNAGGMLTGGGVPPEFAGFVPPAGIGAAGVEGFAGT